MTNTTARTMPRVLRHRRDVLIAVLMPLLIAGAWLLGHAGVEDRTMAIPALIVNSDEMVEQTLPDGRTTPVVAGRLVVSRLTDPEQPTGFDWRLANEDEAAKALEDGSAYVVLRIPKDFSASVASFGGGNPVQARVSITTSQQHDWAAGAATQALHGAITAQFGTMLSEQIIGGIVDGMDDTGAALQQAADGARKLETGANQLGNGLDKLASGQSQLADGADAAATGTDQYVDGVERYVAGADSLASGTREYTDGVGEYANGVREYASGVQQFVSPVADLGDTYGDSIDELGQADALATEADQLLQDAITAYRTSRDTMGDDPAATIEAFCQSLPSQSEQDRCRTSLAGIDVDWQQADDAVDALETKRQRISDTLRAAGGLNGIADKITQFTDGASQLRDASGRLIDGSTTLASGGDALADGAETFADGGDALVSGGRDLSVGITQLADGQRQASDGATQLADGADKLAEGAGSLADGLQSGADRAKNAIKDPERFASLVAHPVASTVTAQHDPGFPAVIAATVIPGTLWLSVLVAGLIRRILPGEELRSTASRGRIVRRALLRLGGPGAIAGGVLVTVAHLVMGWPPIMIPASILVSFAVLATASALALASIALWGRRIGAIATIGLIGAQLLVTRGFMPLELKLPLAATLEPFAPIALAAKTLQAMAAGGALASWGPSLVGVLVWALLSAAAAMWAVQLRQGRSTVGDGDTSPRVGIGTGGVSPDAEPGFDDESDDESWRPSTPSESSEHANRRVSELYEELGAR